MRDVQHGCGRSGDLHDLQLPIIVGYARAPGRDQWLWWLIVWALGFVAGLGMWVGRG